MRASADALLVAVAATPAPPDHSIALALIALASAISVALVTGVVAVLTKARPSTSAPVDPAQDYRTRLSRAERARDAARLRIEVLARFLGARGYDAELIVKGDESDAETRFRARS